MVRLPLGLTPSQAQPEPKRVAAALLNLAFMSSMEPKEVSMAALRSPLAPLVLDGLAMTFQKKLCGCVVGVSCCMHEYFTTFGVCCVSVQVCE